MKLHFSVIDNWGAHSDGKLNLFSAIDVVRAGSLVTLLCYKKYLLTILSLVREHRKKQGGSLRTSGHLIPASVSRHRVCRSVSCGQESQ